MRISKIFLVFLAVLTIFSCRKDQSTDSSITPILGPIEVINSYTIDIQGFVTTPDGIPIENALVKVADQEIRTTEAGSFYLEKLVAPETGLFLLADAEGHFKGGSSVYSHSNNLYTVNITLIPFNELISFESGMGVDIETDDKAKLKIEANSIVDNNGVLYNGIVNAYMYWIDPSAENMTSLSPGPLVGVQDNEMVNLKSFGMIGVELFDSAGQPLNIADGMNAELSFPVPATFQAEAPSEIDLWHFNESLGLWDLDGVARLVNGSYEASVPHFSWWNCDIPTAIGQVCFSLVDEFGNPIGNLQLSLFSGIWGTASAWVGSTGVYCDLVPLGEELDLSVLTFCGDVLTTETIAPITSGENITIVVELGANSNNSINVSGNVYCGIAGPVTNGFVVLSLGDQSYLDYVNDQGDYSIDVITCSDFTYQASLTAFDLDGLNNGAVEIIIDQEDVEQDIDGCNEDLGNEAMIISTINESAIYDICEANISVAEVTIIARNSNNLNSDYVLLGIDGFGEGIFGGNIYATIYSGGVNQEQQGLIEVTISSYSNVPGDKIAGTYKYQNLTGNFIATVQ